MVGLVMTSKAPTFARVTQGRAPGSKGGLKIPSIRWSNGTFDWKLNRCEAGVESKAARRTPRSGAAASPCAGGLRVTWHQPPQVMAWDRKKEMSLHGMNPAIECFVIACYSCLTTAACASACLTDPEEVRPVRFTSLSGFRSRILLPSCL